MLYQVVKFITCRQIIHIEARNSYLVLQYSYFAAQDSYIAVQYN